MLPRRFMLLVTLLIMVPVVGCDLRLARFDYPVQGGSLRVRQTGDELAFTFVDASGIVRAHQTQAIPYGTTNKEAYVLVDFDETVMLLHRQNIIDRLPKDKTNERDLVQDVLEQITTVAYSRPRSAFVSLDTNKVSSPIPSDLKKQILSLVDRIDIHEPVDGNLVAALHNFPSLVAVIIGNQRIEADAFAVQHLPASVRRLNIAPCRTILDPQALVLELNSSGLTDVMVNKDQHEAFGGKLDLKVTVISPD